MSLPAGSQSVARPGAVLIDAPPSALRRVPRLATWDRFVIRRTSRRWRRLAGPPEAGPLTAYVFHPKFWPYIDELEPDHLVYHADDLFERTRGWSEKLDLFQRHLCQKADLVVSSSQTIADVLERNYGRVPTVIANGVDYEAFATAADTVLGQIPPSLWRFQDHGLATRARSAGNWILG